MAQQGRSLATVPQTMNSTPGTHMVEVGNQLLYDTLLPPHTRSGAHAPVHTHAHVHRHTQIGKCH